MCVSIYSTSLKLLFSHVTLNQEWKHDRRRSKARKTIWEKKKKEAVVVVYAVIAEVVENHHHHHHHHGEPDGTPQRNRSRTDQSKSGRMRDLSCSTCVGFVIFYGSHAAAQASYIPHLYLLLIFFLSRGTLEYKKTKNRRRKKKSRRKDGGGPRCCFFRLLSSAVYTTYFSFFFAK